MTIQRVVFVLILIYFLLAALTGITTLGLSHDEGQRGLETIEILEFKHFPLMREFYCGAVISYLQIPLFLIFGATVFAIRFTQVIFSLGSIVCLYYVGQRWFNHYIGLLAALLLSLNPVFIWATRLGAEREEILQIFLFWLGLALVQLYLDKKRKKYLYSGFFTFGLALSAKIMFLGYALGMIATLLFMGKPAANFIKNKIFYKKYTLLVSGIMFLAGSSLVIIYNIASGGQTITKLWNSLFIKGAGAVRGANFGINNLDFINNLAHRLSDFKSLVTGGIFSNYHNFFNLVILGFSLLIVIGYLLLTKQKLLSQKKIIFLLGTYFFLFLGTSFTPREYDHANIIILLPVTQIIVAIAIFSLKNILAKNVLLSMLVPLCALLPLVSNEVGAYGRYLLTLENTGGRGQSACAVYELVDYINRNNIKKNVFSVGEWGPIGNVNFLLKRRVVLPLPYFRYWQEEPDIKFETFIKQYPKAYFIRVIGFDSENGNCDFKFLSESALRKNKKISEVRVFKNRAGEACYGLYQLE